MRYIGMGSGGPGPPKDVVKMVLGWTGGSLASLGFFLFGLFLLLDLLIARPVWDDWKLAVRGETVDATPVALGRQGTGRSARTAGTASYSHDIRVRFKDAHGVEHEAEVVSSDSNVHYRVTTQQPLRIEYDPENPSLARLAGTSAALFGNYILIPLAAGLFGTLLLLMALRRRSLYAPPG